MEMLICDGCDFVLNNLNNTALHYIYNVRLSKKLYLCRAFA